MKSLWRYSFSLSLCDNLFFLIFIFILRLLWFVYFSVLGLILWLVLVFRFILYFSDSILVLVSFPSFWSSILKSLFPTFTLLEFRYYCNNMVQIQTRSVLHKLPDRQISGLYTKLVSSHYRSILYHSSINQSSNHIRCVIIHLLQRFWSIWTQINKFFVHLFPNFTHILFMWF